MAKIVRESKNTNNHLNNSIKYYKSNNTDYELDNTDYELDNTEYELDKINHKSNDTDYESEAEDCEFDNPQKKYKDNDIRNIIFKEINRDFAYGKLKDFKVILMTKNGYINATKLCQDGGKQVKHWFENKSSEKIINDFGKFLNLTRDKLIIKINGGSLTKISGTYVHPHIINPIASWCNTKYAFFISSVINEYHIQKANEEKDKLLKKKDDKIDKMSKKIDMLLNKNTKMDKRLKRLLQKNNEIYDQNVETHNKLDIISDERVPYSGNSKYEHTFAIVENNDDLDEYSDDEEVYNFHVFRTMNKSYDALIRKHKERHPNMKVIFKINYSPNSIHLWNIIKERLASGINKKIDLSGCRFNLANNYTKKQLIKNIKDIHNETLDYDDI